MEVPILETSFDQFRMNQKIVLILNWFEPVEAIVINIVESRTTPENSIVLRVNIDTLQFHEKFWNDEIGLAIREEEGSIAATLPTQPLNERRVILNFNQTGQYVSNHSQIVGGINSIIFPTSGRSGGGMPSRGGKSRKYYKKLSKKYKKSSKKYKKQRKSRKNKNKYSK